MPDLKISSRKNFFVFVLLLQLSICYCDNSTELGDKSDRESRQLFSLIKNFLKNSSNNQQQQQGQNYPVQYQESQYPQQNNVQFPSTIYGSQSDKIHSAHTVNSQYSIGHQQHSASNYNNYQQQAQELLTQEDSSVQNPLLALLTGTSGASSSSSGSGSGGGFGINSVNSGSSSASSGGSGTKLNPILAKLGQNLGLQDVDLSTIANIINFGSFEGMLGRVNEFDKLKCIPRMICQVVAKRQEDARTTTTTARTTTTTTTTERSKKKDKKKSREDSARFINIGGVDTALDQFVKFLDLMQLKDWSLYPYIKGMTEGHQVSRASQCGERFHTCPFSEDQLVYYFNNYNGGFFQNFRSGRDIKESI